MRRGVPVIRETSEELKRQMHKEGHRVKRQRLQMLYLFASGQVRERQAAAAVLAVDRNTVGRWLVVYEQEGMEGLMRVLSPPGVEPAVKGDDLEQLEAALRQPEGFSSYKEVQGWLAKTCGIEMQYQAVYKLVRYKLGAKLKVARPSHPKKTQVP